jgi:hypothetical protein
MMKAFAVFCGFMVPVLPLANSMRGSSHFDSLIERLRHEPADFHNIDTSSRRGESIQNVAGKVSTTMNPVVPTLEKWSNSRTLKVLDKIPITKGLATSAEAALGVSSVSIKGLNWLVTEDKRKVQPMRRCVIACNDMRNHPDRKALPKFAQTMEDGADSLHSYDQQCANQIANLEKLKKTVTTVNSLRRLPQDGGGRTVRDLDNCIASFGPLRQGIQSEREFCQLCQHDANMAIQEQSGSQRDTPSSQEGRSNSAGVTSANSQKPPSDKTKDQGKVSPEIPKSQGEGPLKLKDPELKPLPSNGHLLPMPDGSRHGVQHRVQGSDRRVTDKKGTQDKKQIGKSAIKGSPKEIASEIRNDAVTRATSPNRSDPEKTFNWGALFFCGAGGLSVGAIYLLAIQGKNKRRSSQTVAVLQIAEASGFTNNVKVPEYKQKVTIGRSSQATVSVRDGKVSNIHATIERSKDGFRLSDASSRNGTKLNGQKVTTAILAEGDIIEIGSTKICFHPIAKVAK